MLLKIKKKKKFLSVDILTRSLWRLYQKMNHPSPSNDSEALKPKIQENGRIPLREESHADETFDKVSDWLKSKFRSRLFCL
jgi:hypothetical protein